jgi:hypothetical protein
MQQNGDSIDFAWVQQGILRGLESSGMNPHHLQALQEKVRAISERLESFRTRRAEMGNSGRFSLKGLQDAEQEEAAKVAGELKRLMDSTHLENNLRQKRQALQKGRTSDANELLTEIRGLREDIRVNSTMNSIAAMNIPFTDTLRYEQLYRDALAAGDFITARALEEWPIKSPISPELRQQGQRQRADALDPLLSKEIRELETLHEQFTRITRDALQELPLQDDPIARMAAGELESREGQ